MTEIKASVKIEAEVQIKGEFSLPVGAVAGADRWTNAKFIIACGMQLLAIH